jgi:hypothetical protein
MDGFANNFSIIVGKLWTLTKGPTQPVDESTTKVELAKFVDEEFGIMIIPKVDTQNLIIQ